MFADEEGNHIKTIDEDATSRTRYPRYLTTYLFTITILLSVWLSAVQRTQHLGENRYCLDCIDGPTWSVSKRYCMDTVSYCPYLLYWAVKNQEKLILYCVPQIWLSRPRDTMIFICFTYPLYCLKFSIMQLPSIICAILGLAALVI